MPGFYDSAHVQRWIKKNQQRWNSINFIPNRNCIFHHFTIIK